MLKTFSLNACLHAVRPEAWFETDFERSFSKSHQCKRMQETNAFRTWALLVTSMLAFYESNSISLIKSKFIQNFCVVIAWLFWLSISHLLKLRLEFFFLLKNSNDMHINWRYSFFDLRSVLLALPVCQAKFFKNVNFLHLLSNLLTKKGSCFSTFATNF